nr:hypothetical protein Iba_chr10dCG8560 [Ipomoea batatas]
MILRPEIKTLGLTQTLAWGRNGHTLEPPPQEPVNIIHEVPIYHQGVGQPVYFPVPGVSPTPNNPELHRVQSERRPSAPFPVPPGPSRGPPEAPIESVDGTEYDSPPRRSAF